MTDRLESQLKAWGVAQREAAGAPPAGLLERVTEAPAPPQRRWVALAVAAAVIGVVAGGYLYAGPQSERKGRGLPANSSTPPPPSASASPAPQSAVVPWADLPPRNLPESPIPNSTLDPSVPKCSPTALTATLGRRASSDGSIEQDVIVTNKANRACHLEGALMGLRVTAGETEVFFSVLRNFAGGSQQRTPVVLAPGDATATTLSWYGGCEDPGAVADPVFPAISLMFVGREPVGEPALADEREVPVEKGDLPGFDVGCITEHVLLSDGFGVIDPTRPRSPMSELSASLQLPGEVDAGDVLKYTVTLTNPTDKDIALKPCPAIEQTILGGEVSQQVNSLNCAKSAGVPARGAVTFAMEVSLPVDLQPGEFGVHWRLIDLDRHATGRVNYTGPKPRVAPASALCNPPIQTLPCGKGLEPGASYPYRLRTHCGIQDLWADGRYWRPVPGQDLGDHNPPKGFDDPYEVGTLTNIEPGERLEFRAASGATITFVPGDMTAGGECN